MQTPPLHDLVISAVAYDANLVAELTASMATRLQTSPLWAGAPSPVAVGMVSPLREDESRVVLVLPQRLWGHDKTTVSEAEIVRDRARRTPRSVIVVTLDDEPIPQWMRGLRHRRLRTAGVDGVVEFVLQAIAEAGGRVTSRAMPVTGALPLWPEPPQPYLRQPRAHSALRRELDALSDAVEAPFETAEQGDGDHIRELTRLPNRVVARVDSVGVSFSWVPGRTGFVADGRLMVIEWSDIAANQGPSAFRTARPTREQVYSVEAINPDEWYWRADGPNGRASSTENLVGEWMDGATMTAAVHRS
jgi:hypothetical protein